jgi:hypothetical protein
MPVTLVNMIPHSLSSESGRDSEPNISASFLDPSRIAASVFTPDPAGSGNAPIYISTDGGNTWTLNVVLPGGNKTNDTTLRFVGGSNVLYAGILRVDTGALNILRASDFTAPTLMTVLVSKTDDDQPYVEGGTVLGGTGAGADRVYIGENDFGAASGHTATIDFSLDAATSPPPANFVTTTRIETRATSGQDGPPIRPAVHLDGTVYGLFMAWRSATTMDIVVVRDDNWASGATPFTALTDTDGSAGKRVATGVSRCPFGDFLGTQRVGGQCAIAVDPRDSSTVYVAWADGTLGSNQTIHVRRSTDRGVTWSADLVSITTATNPGFAVNRLGAVGFLYQQLHNPGSGNRWQTHFQYSKDVFGTATDIVLADLADNKGSYTGPNPIGDYAGLISVGKNFYGIFCGFNTPDNANFPQGVTYQRNADFTTHALTDLASNQVAASIDPFFFRYDTVSESDDFYVRDWTDSPTSGDNGAEPSTHAVFYHTSDVWNRRGTLPGPFPNDQPDNEDAGNGSGNIGDNWAFARIRRNAPSASGSQDVTAHFLVSKFGTGSNYVDATSGDPDITFSGPDPVVTFAAADLGPLITDAYHWHLSAVASTHLCLAVEITAPNDPYTPPSLAGNAPGWPTTDLRIINDNNKAQRNMGLSTTPARGVGMSDCYYAIVHNAAPFARDMELRYEVPRDILSRLREAAIQVVGGEKFVVGEAGTVHLKNMGPGEYRWIGLHFPAAHGDAGDLYTVNFLELSGGVVVNGFAMGARLGSLDAVIRDKLHRMRSVFGRVAAGWHVSAAREISERCHRHIDEDRYDSGDFLRFLREHIRGIERVFAELLREHGGGDAFGIGTAVRGLISAIEQGDPAAVAVSASCLMNRADSWITMLQSAQGDVADILQTVRWQRRLFTVDRRLKELGRRAEVILRSERFIRGYERRELTNRDYPGFLAELTNGFEEVAQGAPDLALASMVGQLGRTDDLRRLQRAHAQLLRKIQQSHVAG